MWLSHDVMIGVGLGRRGPRPVLLAGMVALAATSVGFGVPRTAGVARVRMTPWRAGAAKLPKKKRRLTGEERADDGRHGEAAVVGRGRRRVFAVSHSPSAKSHDWGFLDIPAL